jgi:hypothetical protein
MQGRQCLIYLRDQVAGSWEENTRNIRASSLSSAEQIIVITMTILQSSTDFNNGDPGRTPYENFFDLGTGRPFFGRKRV